MQFKFTSLICLLFFTFSSYSQNKTNEISYPSKKGQFYAHWGWNRASYSKSNISFSGPDHDFVLKDVIAKDEPLKRFGFKDHLNPFRMTVPQTNFKLGYFLNENYSISIGFDHMKYVVESPQNVFIQGSINDTSSYNGTYNNENITIEEGFLEFEYTDGLNYISIELNRFDNLKFIKTNPNKIYLSSILGFGSGIIFPRTDATLLGRPNSDNFHVSGYGLSTMLGLNVTFIKNFFIQSELKGGYINMFNSKTTNNNADKAKHHFFFLERNLVFGARFNLFN